MMASWWSNFTPSFTNPEAYRTYANLKKQTRNKIQSLENWKSRPAKYHHKLEDMTVERPNVESADKIEAVDKLSRGIGVRQGTKWGVWWWWQISRINKSPFPEQLEEEVSVDGAKHRVHAEVEEEHFVDPGQGFHPECRHASNVCCDVSIFNISVPLLIKRILRTLNPALSYNPPKL